MPTIPILDQSVSTPQTVAGPRASGQSIASPYAQPAGAASQGLDDLQQAAWTNQRNHDITAVNEMYSTSFGPAMRSLLYDPQNGLMAKQGKNAMDALPDVQNMAETVRTQALNNLQNDNQKKIFDSISRRHLEMEMDSAYRYVGGQNKVWQDNTSAAMVSQQVNSAVDHYNDSKFVDNAIGGGLYEIQMHGMNDGQSSEVINQSANAFVRTTRTAIAHRLMVDDPLAAQSYVQQHASELAGPQFPQLAEQVKRAAMPVQAKMIADGIIKDSQAAAVSNTVATGNQATVNATVAQPSAFDQSMQFVLAKEGGYKATDGNTGAPVNFGINQKANPDIDVKNLTKDTATAIYKQRYWDAIGGDNLPPATAMMAMDAAVNQGVPFAKKILAQSGGDVGQMAQMRRDQYQQITANDPTLSRFKGQWLARVDDAQAQANAQSTAAPASTSQPTSVDMRAGVGNMIAQAQDKAEQLHPGDPVFSDLAVSQLKAHYNNIIASQVAQQMQAHSIVVSALMGPKGSDKPTSMDDLSPAVRQQFAVMTPEAQRGMLALMDQNAKQAAGTPTKSDPATVLNLFSRIHLPDDDPNKIRLASQIAPSFMNGLNWEDYGRLKTEIDHQQSVSGRTLTKDVQNAGTTAQKMLTGNMSATTINHPELADEAANRFRFDLENKVTAAQKAGKDPSSLFTPGSPDYVLDPNRVAAYMPTEAQIAANKARAAAPAAQQYPTATNPKTGERAMLKDGKWQPLR